jgi:predicted fused transcriptional regulator/phosphomethylpyrimidine kinase
MRNAMKMRQLSVFAVCFTLVAGVALLYGVADDADVSKAVLEQQLSAVRKARVESAQAALAAMEAAFRAQTVTVVGLVDVTRNLAEAEADAATKPEDEIAAWNRYVKASKQAEEAAKQLYDLGTKGGEPAIYYTAKQERERAQILLLKAQIKARK